MTDVATRVSFLTALQNLHALFQEEEPLDIVNRFDFPFTVRQVFGLKHPKKPESDNYLVSNQTPLAQNGKLHVNLQFNSILYIYNSMHAFPSLIYIYIYI